MTLAIDRLRAVYGYPASYADCGGAKIRHAVWNVTLETSLMDRLIDWKLRSPSMAKKMQTSAIAEEVHMMRQFTIELRVNYTDNDKNDTMRQAVAQAAVHMLATANLLADGVKPDIACWSDDWFSGKQEINALEDVLQKGLDAAPQDDTPAMSAEMSSELMAAVRDGS